jgi:hypothetical protein
LKFFPNSSVHKCPAKLSGWRIGFMESWR